MTRPRCYNYRRPIVRSDRYTVSYRNEEVREAPLCSSCKGDGCDDCQGTGFAGGREP